MKNSRGFSLLEIFIAMPLLLVGLGVTFQMIQSSSESSKVQRLQSSALHAAESTVERLSQELRQSTTDVDPELGAKYQLVTDGIKFRRVVGVGTDGENWGRQLWSDEIYFHWDRTKGVITRKSGAGDSIVIAKGVSDFSCVNNAEGQLICMVECTRETADGKAMTSRRTLRVTPLNKLQ